jgi:hypothetical protein
MPFGVPDHTPAEFSGINLVWRQNPLRVFSMLRGFYFYISGEESLKK